MRTLTECGRVLLVLLLLLSRMLTELNVMPLVLRERLSTLSTRSVTPVLQAAQPVLSLMGKSNAQPVRLLCFSLLFQNACPTARLLLLLAQDMCIKSTQPTVNTNAQLDMVPTTSTFTNVNFVQLETTVLNADSDIRLEKKDATNATPLHSGSDPQAFLSVLQRLNAMLLRTTVLSDIW